MKNTLSQWIADDKIFFPALVFLLVIPLFYQGHHLGWPRVKGGDEPHYLVQINSLLKDGDLDVRNNYDSALKGSSQAGENFAGSPLDHHTTWMEGGQKWKWWDRYERQGEKWTKGRDGFWVPTLKPGAAGEDPAQAEYSSHPPGSPLLICALLWPLRASAHVESWALFASSAVFLFSILGIRKMIRRYVLDPAAVNLTVLLIFLGTPAWHYGRTLFNEPFLLAFAVTAYSMVLGRKSGFWPGAMVGLGMLMKPVFLLMAVPLFWFLVREGKPREAARLTAGPLLAAAFILALNDHMFGSPLTPSIRFVFGNPLEALAGLWFSWDHGILPFAPVALLALVFWRRFLREKGGEAVLLGLGFVVYFLLFVFWKSWQGGWCFGPRLIVPVLPLLMAPLFYLPASFRTWSRFQRGLCVLVCSASLAINFLGALDVSWSSHPLVFLWEKIAP